MFDKVLGHESVKKYLSEQIKCGDISHAYTFYGINSIGKKKLAFEFAKELLKTENLETCPDFKYIEKIEGKTEILVEQVKKQITEDINMRPACSSYKVYIIDNADQMNTFAQNKLLKTLEEPPSFVVIILITSFFDRLLTTIKSRTSNINFGKLTDEEILQITGENTSNDIIKYSEGSLDKILRMKDEIEKEKCIQMEELVKKIILKDKVSVIQGFKNISLKNDSLDYLEYLLMNLDNYSAISKIESAKTKVRENANEEIAGTILAIELCK